MIKIIEAPFGLGAQITETTLAPIQIEKHLSFAHTTIVCDNNYAIKPLGKARLQSVLEFCSSLASNVSKALDESEFPIVIGGDHSIAIGTWSAITSKLGVKGEFGLLWIDAHLDSHNYETSPSKAYHGMPLAALLGNGEPELVNLVSHGAKLSFKHVVVIGARDFEPEEHEFLLKNGVKIFYMNDINLHGLDHIFQEAVKIASAAIGGYGISIDMDAFDPTYAPGVGSRADGGIIADEFFAAVDALITNKLKALEIVECNPLRDEDNKTVLLSAKIANTFATKLNYS